MITFKEYGDNYAKGLNCFEDIYRIGLLAGELEEFTKGYAKLAIASQKEQDYDLAVGESRRYIINEPLIELL